MHVHIMSWKSLRLELARTREFPNGSPNHLYLLHLPLDASGIVDEAALGREPNRALVRRSWPDEPDISGYVVRTPRGWVLSYRPGEEDDEIVFHLETHRLVPGEYITLTDPDGDQLPFRVMSIHPLDEPSATETVGPDM